MPTEVCMHRRNGDECITTLCFLFFRGDSGPASLSSDFDRSSRLCKTLAILAPSALDWVQPPYVRGVSYGVGEVRCHFGSAESNLVPCLESSVSMAFKASSQALGSRRGVDGAELKAKTKCHEPHNDNCCWRATHCWITSFSDT